MALHHEFRCHKNNPVPARRCRLPLTAAVGANLRVVSYGPRIRTALNNVLGGSAASVLTITFGLSYALLIFAGPLAPYLSYGVAATFISSAVLASVIALGSSLPFAVGGPESSTAAMTGILASSLVERMVAADPSAPLLAPVLITLGISTIATGIVLCGFGITRMGRAIRYVPYPVVGGFLLVGIGFVLRALRDLSRRIDLVSSGGVARSFATIRPMASSHVIGM